MNKRACERTRKKVIEADTHAKRLALYEKSQQQRRFLYGYLNEFRKRLAFVQQDSPNEDLKKAIKKLRANITSFDNKIGNLREEKIVGKKTWLPPIGGITTKLLLPDQPTPSCPSLSGSVDNPSDFALYTLEEAREGNDGWTRGCLYYDYVRRKGGPPPQQWVSAWPITEAQAIAFEAYLKEDDFSFLSFPWFEKANFMWKILCLRYTFPAPLCDSILSWNTKAVINLNNGVEAVGEKAGVSFQPVIHEQPEGGSFPAFEDLMWVPNVWGIDQDSNMNARALAVGYSNGWDIQGLFRVRAGVESNIYIGLGVQMIALNGEVSVWDGKNMWDAAVFRVVYPFQGPTVSALPGIHYDLIPC